MNKFTELLEKHCQWIAIAIGGLFLVAMLWTYVLNQPVAVKSGTTEVTPDMVDSQVRTSVAEELDRQIRDTSGITPPTSTAEVEKPWVDRLMGKDRPITQLAADWPTSMPLPFEWKENEKPPENIALVDKLPEVPPSTPADKPQEKRAFVGAAPPPGQGGQPAPPPDPAVANAAGRDLNYVVYTYNLHIDELAAAFKAVHIPAEAKTSIVGIKLLRRELKPNGVDWTDPIEVSPIKNGATILPVPGAGAGPEPIAKFLNWAAAPEAQANLVRPSFYPILAGEGPWDPPAAAIAAAALQDAEAKRLADQRKAVQDRLAAQAEERARRAEEARQRASQPRQPTPRRENRQATDPNRPNDYSGLVGAQLAQAQPPQPADAPGFMEVPNDQPPVEGAPGQQPGGPNAAPAQGGLPQPNFLPAAGPPLVTGWAYDETVEEGKTYQYQVVWIIKNPVYQAGKNVIDPKQPQLAQIPTISSKVDPNGWSREVTIPTSTEYFLAGPSWQPQNMPSKIRVQVFKNTGGKWQEQVIDAWAGDRIGSGNPNTETNSVLVDIRYDNRQQRAYVLVLGPNGQLTERDPSKDRVDQRRLQLQGFVSPPAAPAGVAGGGGPGVPSDAPGMR